MSERSELRVTVQCPPHGGGELPPVDMHCHLTQAAAPVDGNPAILSVTFTPDEYVARPAEVPGSRTVWAVGIHPWEYGSDDQLEAFARQLPDALAVGEIGLDGTDRARSPMDVQREVLLQILANPETKRRIGSIHGWMAYQEVVDVLRSEPTPGIVYHWFMGMGDTLEQAVALDIFFSVNDAMLSLPEGREIVTRLPHDRVLTETDGPYIQAGTGQAMNPGDDIPGGPALRPGELSNTEQQVGDIWGESADAVRQQIWHNLAELESRVEVRPFGAAEMLATA
jgi:TatD DNase family protein